MEHPGFPSPSFLFGTMHVQDLRAFGKWELVKGKILECGAFAVEFDLESDSPNRFSATQIPDNQQLTDLLSEKKYSKLRKILLRSTGFDIAVANRTLPFLLIGAVSGQILRSDFPTSLDEQLWAFAKAEGKQMLGIETLDEQLSVMAKIPLKAQVKMLLGLSRNVSAYRKQLIHLTELYAKEDLKRLTKVVKHQAGGLRKIMLYRRNEVMAERVFAMAQEQPTMAAIGAGHLSGGKGVLRLLKKRGVKVRPVQS